MFGKQKTLIIDHNSERNNRIKNYLDQDHFICYQAKTLDEFNSLYTNNNYDCIILEDVFPGINTNIIKVKQINNRIFAFFFIKLISILVIILIIIKPTIINNP